MIRELFLSTGELIDPHTATGLVSAERSRKDQTHTLISLATAHPGKFPDAIEDATGIRPQLPSQMEDLFSRVEQFQTLPNDFNLVKNYISETLA